jgi:hypothetical protein
MRKVLLLFSAALLMLSVQYGYAQKDRNYYKQIVKLQGGTEVRLLPDDISKINIIRTNDYPKMTAWQFIQYGNIEADSVAQFLSETGYNYNSLNNENASVNFYLPDNQAWSKASKAIDDMHCLSLPSRINAVNINGISSPSKISSNYTYYPPKLSWIKGTMMFEGAKDNITTNKSITIQQEVLNGEVSVTGESPIIIIKKDLVIDDWKSYSDDIAYFSSYTDFKSNDSESWITFEPNGKYAKPDVLINLPQPFAWAYDLYCVIAPDFYGQESTEEAKPNVLNFQIYYNDQNGKSVSYLLTPEGTSGTTPNFNTAFITDPTKVDTLYLGQFTFPISYYGTTVKPFMRISCPISVFNSTQMGNYTRTLNIMNIIMRPKGE